MPVRKGQHIGGIRTLDDVRARCYVDEVTSCWHWRLCVLDKPRVVLYIPGRGPRDMNGRRAALLLSGVKMTSQTMVWRHHGKCHSHDCVNPAHAAHGNRAAMTAHLMAHGASPTRVSPRSIEAATQRVAKIDAQQAAQIRASDEPWQVLAQRHGLSRSQISNIRRGLAWAPAGYSVFRQLAKVHAP